MTVKNSLLYRTVFLLLIFIIPASLFGEDATIAHLFDRYKGVTSFSTEFRRIFTAKLTNKVTKDEGDIDYLAPEFISVITKVGKKVVEETYITPEKTTFIEHKKKSVLIKNGASGMGDYLVFLRGPKAINKSFTIKNSTDSIAKANKVGLVVEKGSLLVKLTPKKPMADLKYMFLVAQKGEVIGLIIIDQLKNINQFFFTKMEYNKKLNKKQFAPKTPRGYEVSHF